MSKTTNVGEITWEASIEREEAARERWRAGIDPDEGSPGGQLGENPTGIAHRGAAEVKRARRADLQGQVRTDSMSSFLSSLPPSLPWEPPLPGDWG